MVYLLGNQETKALFYGLAAVLCWSTVATAFKIALRELDTFQLVFFANLTAASLLLSIISVRGDFSRALIVFKTHWRLTLIAGVLNPVIYYLILFQAYELLPAQVAMSINYTWAIVLSFMAVFFLGQRLVLADGIAALVCYSGVFIIATGGQLHSFSQAGLKGLGLALFSTVIWAGYWTLSIADKREPVIGLALNFMIALPLTAGICAVFSGFSLAFNGLIAATYIGVVEMAIAFLLWSVALNLSTNASRVSNLIFLSPFISLVLISQVLGEEISSSTFLGLILIIAGLVYQQKAHSQGSGT